MKRVFNGLLVTGSLLCLGFPAAVAGSSAAMRDPNVRDVPTSKQSIASAITFPTAGFYYSVGVWNRGFPGARGDSAGCGNSAGDICGTATAADGSIAKVEVSVKRGSGDSAQYWDGAAFNSNEEVFITADGTTSWTLTFGFDRFSPGIYTLHTRATDSTGQSESGSLRIFGVSPDYTVIPVISSMEVLGKGSHPAFRKVPAMMNLKVFDRAEIQTGDDGAIEALSYANIWERTAKWVPSTSQLMNADESSTPLAAMNCEDSESQDCPVRVQYGNVDAYFYEIMVPSNSSANREAFSMSGSYLVIGKSLVCLNGSESADAGSDSGMDGRCIANGGVTTPVFTGASLYSVQPGSLLQEKHLNVTVDGRGKIHSMRSRPIEGTALVISVPAYMDFNDATESVPIVYESVDGDWQAKINIAPPKGFTVDTRSVEVQGGSDNTAVAQITVSGFNTGSTRTGLTHTITYQGKTIDIQMYLEMDDRQRASKK